MKKTTCASWCIFFISISIALASCFTKKAVVKTTTTPSKVETPKLAEKPMDDRAPKTMGTTFAEAAPRVVEVPKPTNVSMDLDLGKKLYQVKCTTCHALKNPTAFSEIQWKSLVPEMCQGSNAKGMKISKADQDLILAYVLAARIGK
jgi:cytochrome c5